MVIVFDLDGTLSKANTYKVFLVALLVFLVVTFQFGKLFHYGKIINQRGHRQIGRFDMKRNFYWLYQKMNLRNSFDRFLHKILIIFIRKNLIVHAKENEAEWVLATAAYASYSKRIASELGFKYCIATDSNDIDKNVECINETKKNRLINLLKGGNIDVFYTDHEDDLPLIRVAKKTFLVNPTSKLLKQVRRLDLQNIDYSFV